MFQQVEVEIRLAGAAHHDLVVSYVVAAPMWKPTYRVVLPEVGARTPALLQGWAVVDNTTGEQWERVAMSLTSGAPIAFRYDLHTPRDVPRSDLTEAGVRKQAAVAIGETSYGAANEADAGDASGPDTDGDGTADPEDKCPTVPETRNGYQDEDGCPDEIPMQLAKFTGTIKGIYFDLDKDTIKPKSKPVLDRAVSVLNEFSTIRIEISGHTDSTGSVAYNKDLSGRRAASVKRYLVEHGVDSARIETRGAGPDEPVDTNKTAAGRAKNRRIEFTILVQ